MGSSRLQQSSSDPTTIVDKPPYHALKGSVKDMHSELESVAHPETFNNHDEAAAGKTNSIVFETLNDTLTALRLTANTAVSSMPSELEILLVVCLAHVCIGFAMGSVSPAMEPVTIDLNLSDSWRGVLGASALAGNILGSPMGGSLADYGGRRSCVIVAWIVFAISAALQGIALNIEQLCIARAFVGWSVGAHYTGITAYLSESLPPERVGGLLSLTELTFFLGNFLSIGIGAWFRFTIADDPSLRWRLTLSVCALPVVAAAVWFYLRCPETDTFLENRRRRRRDQQHAAAEARASKREELDTSGNVETAAPEPGGESAVVRSPSTSTADSAIPAVMSMKASLVFVSVFWSSLVVPTYAISAFAVTIIQSLQISIDPFLLNTFLGAAALLGVACGTVLVDAWGRRPLLLLSQLGTGAAFLFMTIINPFTVKDTPAYGPPEVRTWAIVSLVGLFLLFEILSGAGAPLALVYPAEVFDPQIKGIGSGIAAMNSRICCVFSILTMSIALTRLGVGFTLGALGVMSLLASLVTIHMAPDETVLKQYREAMLGAAQARNARKKNGAPQSNSLQPQQELTAQLIC